MPTLSSLSDELFEATDRLLGDPFTYTPFGGSPIDLVNHTDVEEIRRDFGGSSATASDAAIEVPQSLVPAWDKRDLIFLPETGLDYHPRDVRKRGPYWRMLLKKKPG